MKVFIGKDLAADRSVLVFIEAFRLSLWMSWDWLPPLRWYARTELCGEPLGVNEYYAGTWTGLCPVGGMPSFRDWQYGFSLERQMMTNYDAIRLLYRAYMLEEQLNVFTLARRLNDAWRARGQKPRMNFRFTVAR